MKLVNSLVVAFLGTLMAAGCTVTDDTSTDGGPTTDGGGTDTTPSGDTGGSDAAKDTAVSETTGDTGGDAGSCGDCVTANCKTEYTACVADTQCKTGVDCINACTTKDCKNACVTAAEADAGSSPKIDDLVSCLSSKCSAQCGL